MQIAIPTAHARRALPREAGAILASGAAGAGLGYAAWSGLPLAAGLAVLLPVFWGTSRTRARAATLTFAYYVAASYVVAGAIGLFFGGDSPLSGYLGWLAASALLAAPWVILWAPAAAPWRGVLALALLTLPPLGLLGYYSPIAGAGEWLPATGWLGVAAVFAVAAVAPRWPRSTVAAGLAVGALANIITPQPPAAPEGWHAIDTARRSLGYRHGAVDRLAEFADYQTMFQAAAELPAGAVVVFPESQVPTFGEDAREFFEREFAAVQSRRQTLVFGTMLFERGLNYNTIIATTPGAPAWLQRMPPPATMWRPWDAQNSVEMRVGGPQTWHVAGRHVAPLICYEVSLTWPILASMASRPDSILVIANAYWGRGTLMAEQARAYTRAWSRLFNLPAILAINT